MQLQPLPTDRLLFVGLQSVMRSEVSVSKANAIPYNRVRAPGSARVAAENRVLCTAVRRWASVLHALQQFENHR